MIGEKIKSLRNEKKISQTELANALFVSRQTISRWEREQTIPNTENIVMLADFFEIDANYFLNTYGFIEGGSVKKKDKLNELKKVIDAYKLDIYIFSLLIIPFFYILLAPLSFISMFYSIKHKKKYTVIVIILVISLTVYFSLDMIYILRLLFGSGTSTTEVLID